STFSSDTVAAGSYTSHFLERTNFSDVLLTSALAYRKYFGKEIEGQRSFISAGITYELEKDLNADRFFVNERLREGDIRPAFSDTLVDKQSSLRLPAALGFGLAYGRLYSYTIGADLKMQNWERYRNVEAENEEGLGKGYRLSVGGEWTPNYVSRTYYNRMTYRTGVQLEKTPFLINGEEINEFGINFGISFPVGASGVHTGFSWGQRGKTDNDLIRERFFRVSLGVTLNERWFERYKYD
ncbi:MAG: hypothetical protein KY428_05320, partial [Bacteroidetes bacterium]|nr:hypothetical protein [Bacteroidota bacterium]